MASVSRDANGTKRVLFTDGDGQRRSVRLGAVSVKVAETCRLRMESLLACRTTGTPWDSELAAWVRDLPDRMYGRLARVGLVEPRAKTATPTLARLVEDYFATLNVKPGTRTVYEQTRAALETHFGAERRLSDIGALDADRWRAAMVEAGYAPATISKRVKTARAIFARGVRWRMLTENPLADLKAGKQTNPARKVFVSRDAIAKVMDTAPDAEWRLLIALSRFAGLRVPSEALALTWSDVDWERSRLRIRCSKTEHHEGAGERVVPLFPEVRPHLQAVFDAAPEGSTFVISRYRNGSNPNPQLRRLIRRAGLTPWPRTWHNMRASRATELAAVFPGHVAAAWLGHAESVADEHYRMVRDEDYTRAVEGPDGAESGAQGAQNAAQRPAAPDCTGSQRGPETLAEAAVLRADAEACGALQGCPMTPTGFEPVLPP